LNKGNPSIEKKFSEAIKQELINVSSISPLHVRPITTVHFGGGTPSHLNRDRFEKIVKACNDHLAIHRKTEWAIESTANMISNEKLYHLKKMGFTRLHVGVQTLDDHERKRIGRKLECREVLKRLEIAMLNDFVTSVDIIYGLPDQSLKSLVNSLTILVESGIHGISLYQLNQSRRNARFLKRITAAKHDALADWTMFQVADQFLIKKGYVKNHFCHYALPIDENLYSNYARRGEDLLALGPSADGCIGPYLYRHYTNFSKYIKGVSSKCTNLEGGLEHTTENKKVYSLINSLLCSHIDKEIFFDLNIINLFDRWIDYGLLIERNKNNLFTLSANGSWFLYSMINEVNE
jgi:oxygen-independent coproporphyrinogen-3 oxidase